MSALVIRHKLFALKDDLHHMREQPDSIEHDAAEVQEALDDWWEKYPHDPWLAAACWNLATLFEELPGQDAQKNAVQTLTSVRTKFPDTDFARYAIRDLNRGVGIRPWPRWAAASAPKDAPDLTATILTLRGPHGDVSSESDLGRDETQFWQRSHNGDDPAYARAAWELAVLYERVRGEQAREHAIRLLALLVDRFPTQVYGIWAMRDLKRGVGVR